MASNRNDNDVNSKKSPLVNDNDVRAPTEATSLPLSQHTGSANGNKQSNMVTQHNRLQLAMNVADTIRRYENASTSSRSKFEADDGDSSEVSNNSYYNVYAHPIISKVRRFWDTPGIQAGCLTACCLTLPIIPLRRTLLRYMNNNTNFGTSLPDLLFTPAITMIVAQCSVYVGTCYGVLHYLNKISSVPITQAEATTLEITTLQGDLQSSIVENSVVDSICHDPVLVDASNVLTSYSTDERASSSFARQFDIRERVTTALYDAVTSCRKRREFSQMKYDHIKGE